MYLPKNEYQFYIKHQGNKTKQWFEGTFVVRCCLTLEEQVQVAINVDRLNQGSVTIAPEYGLVNRALAEVQMRIVNDKDGKPQCPTWWTENRHGAGLFDSNIVFQVFADAMKAEEDWAKRLDEDTKKAEKRAEEKPAEAPKEAPAATTA